MAILRLHAVSATGCLLTCLLLSNVQHHVLTSDAAHSKLGTLISTTVALSFMLRLSSTRQAKNGTKEGRQRPPGAPPTDHRPLSAAWYAQQESSVLSQGYDALTCTVPGPKTFLRACTHVGSNCYRHLVQLVTRVDWTRRRLWHAPQRGVGYRRDSAARSTGAVGKASAQLTSSCNHGVSRSLLLQLCVAAVMYCLSASVPLWVACTPPRWDRQPMKYISALFGKTFITETMGRAYI